MWGRKEGRTDEPKWTIITSDETVVCVKPQGDRQSVTWDDLKVVEVRTNDSGPWGADVWWVLIGTSSFVEIPQGATGEKELLDKLLALPGFDHGAFILAMGSTENAVFKCWTRMNKA